MVHFNNYYVQWKVTGLLSVAIIVMLLITIHFPILLIIFCGLNNMGQCYVYVRIYNKCMDFPVAWSSLYSVMMKGVFNVSYAHTEFTSTQPTYIDPRI